MGAVAPLLHPLLPGGPIGGRLFGVIAEFGGLDIGEDGGFVLFELGIGGRDRAVEQALGDRAGGVVGTKDLGREAGEELGEVLADVAAANAGKDLGQVAAVAAARGPGAFDEVGEVFDDGRVELDRPVPEDRVLAEEFELGLGVTVQLDVFRPEGGGADRVGLIGLFFVADPQGEPVDEVAGGRQFHAGIVGAAEILEDAGADAVEVLGELHGLVEFELLALLFDRGGVAQPDVFELAGELVLPAGDPDAVGLPDDFAPVPVGDGGIGAEVEGDVLLVGALLPAAAEGVLATAHKDAAGLGHVIGELDPFAVDDGVAEFLFERLAPEFAFGGGRFAFFGSEGGFGLAFGFDDGDGGPEIDLVRPERRVDPELDAQIGHEIVDKDGVLDVGGALFARPREGHLFLFGRQHDRIAANVQCQVTARRSRCDDDSVMNELFQQFQALPPR